MITYSTVSTTISPIRRELHSNKLTPLLNPDSNNEDIYFRKSWSILRIGTTVIRKWMGRWTFFRRRATLSLNWGIIDRPVSLNGEGSISRLQALTKPKSYQSIPALLNVKWATSTNCSSETSILLNVSSKISMFCTNSTSPKATQVESSSKDSSFRSETLLKGGGGLFKIFIVVNKVYDIIVFLAEWEPVSATTISVTREETRKKFRGKMPDQKRTKMSSLSSQQSDNTKDRVK